MNRKGFTGLEIVAVIWLSALALRIGWWVVHPESYKKAKCEAAQEQLQTCKEGHSLRRGLSDPELASLQAGCGDLYGMKAMGRCAARRTNRELAPEIRELTAPITTEFGTPR